MEGDVGYIDMAAALVLVAVAVALSLWQKLGLAARMTSATLRAIVQLLLVGAGLGLVIDPGRPLWWSWVWVAAMTAYAGNIVRRRTPEIPNLLSLAVAAFAATAAVTLGTLFGLDIFPLQGRTLVPLAGMMIGNSMNATVLAARRVVGEFRDHRAEVEVRLSLGQSSQQAARPYVAEALRTALIPQIETTKAVGLVFLPGAMTGLILAGVDPLDAVLVQAVVMFMVLGSVATTTTVIGLGLTRRLFTDDHRLVRLTKAPDQP